MNGVDRRVIDCLWMVGGEMWEGRFMDGMLMIERGMDGGVYSMSINNVGAKYTM